MNENEFVSGMRFVADVVGSNIETLPSYEIVPPEVTALSQELQSEQPQPKVASNSRASYAGQQGVKRTCGHAHKSVRMDHKK